MTRFLTKKKIEVALYLLNRYATSNINVCNLRNSAFLKAWSLRILHFFLYIIQSFFLGRFFLLFVYKYFLRYLSILLILFILFVFYLDWVLLFSLLLCIGMPLYLLCVLLSFCFFVMIFKISSVLTTFWWSKILLREPKSRLSLPMFWIC